MLAWEAGMYFYSGIIGALIGAVFVVFALNRSHNSMINLLESYWKSDILALKRDIEQFKLSTKIGEKSVKKDQKPFAYKR